MSAILQQQSVFGQCPVLFAACALVFLTACGGGRTENWPDVKTTSNPAPKAIIQDTLAPPPKTPENAVSSINTADYKHLSFDILASYTYHYPNNDGKPFKHGDHPPSQIPKNIKAFDGKKIAIKGFMIPLQFEDNGAKRFILAQFVPACCFGDTINQNQWIDVEMNGGKRSKYYSAQAVQIFGTLEVGEELEDGYVSSIYRLKADEVIPPEENKNM